MKRYVKCPECEYQTTTRKLPLNTVCPNCNIIMETCQEEKAHAQE